MYHDGEFKEHDVDVEICEAVTELQPDSDILKIKKMPAVKQAVCILHKGAYDQFGCAYAFATKWIEQNGYKISASPRESYIDGIWNKENEADWLTEIQFPVEKL